MFSVYRLMSHTGSGPRPLWFTSHRTLPEAVEQAIRASTIGPEDVLLTVDGKLYRIEAIYRDGVRVGFSASVPE